MTRPGAALSADAARGLDDIVPQIGRRHGARKAGDRNAAVLARLRARDGFPIVEALFIAVWLLELVQILIPGIGLGPFPGAAMAALFAAALCGLRRPSAILVGGLGSTALAIAAVRGDWQALAVGLESASVFVAFFGTLIVLRTTAERRPETARARTLFAALPADQRAGATLYGAHVTGAVLVVGAHAVMSPIYGAEAPSTTRFSGAVISQRGLGLAGLWSPFWVAMVVAYQHLPDVPLWSIMCLGAALAIPGLLIGQAMAGWARWGGLAALLPVAPSVLIAASAVVMLASFTPLRPLEALVTGIPILCLLALAPAGRETVLDMARTTIARTPMIQGELALVTCAFVLGRVLVGGLGDIDAADWLAANMPPPPAVIAAVIGVPTLLALIGIHQIVTITVLLVLLVEIPSGVADLVLMESALIAWGFASMVGLSAISTIAAASLFEVRLERLAWGPNVGFALVFGVVAVAALSLINRAIS